MAALLIKIIAVLIAAAVICMVIDNHRFVVRRYRLRSHRIRRPVKLVFLADLHEKCYGKDNDSVVKKIKEIRPDAIIVGGDLIVYGAVKKIRKEMAEAGEDTREVGTEWMRHSLSLMRRLTQICPVWFVQGNHELRLEHYKELNAFNDKFCEEMQKAGVRMLGSSAVELVSGEGAQTGIILQGLELPMKYYKKFKKTPLSCEEINALIGEPDRSAYTILVSHIPVYFPAYAQWGCDLCLCGHVHGGLMRLPLIGGIVGTRPSLFPKYSGGQYFYKAVTGGKQHLSSMVLTCGLGMHTLPVRIFNPGELSVIELGPADRRQEDENGTEQDNSSD